MPVRRFNIRIFYGIFCCLPVLNFLPAIAQPPDIIKKINVYKESVVKDSLQRMVEVKKIAPDIVYDLRYATTDNFTGKKLYKNGKATFVRLAVGKALQNVITRLKVHGLGLKVWDAYRPYAATKKMWQLVQDERYVANPAKGSGHNRGLAVDVTLISLRTGAELNMGTGFDNFTDTAHHSFKALPDSILKNRDLLKTVMEQSGFTALETEWWHYSFPNNRNYGVLDLPFKKLEKYRR